MDYAIIRVGNKQHRVRDGETLVVDRIRVDQGETFDPDVLLGGDGVSVTAKVLGHERGPKIRIGKYRKRTGYKRHNGFRAATTRIEVSLGAGKKSAAAKKRAAEKAEPVEAVGPEAAATTEPTATSATLPPGYEKMTVVTIAAEAKGWPQAELEAALAYEREHAKRKGALAALEAALAEEEG